jgi:radical SAM superfamily enzyme YgiQ (UPF0313 family)
MSLRSLALVDNGASEADAAAPPIDLRSPGDILLVSCYELGHQPLAAALPLGFLERAGFAPDALDIAVEAFDTDKIAHAKLVAISVPMHTALRLGIRVAENVRQLNPEARVVFYGLYAALNADYLLEHGGDYCIGGECETPLVSLAEALQSGTVGPIDGVTQRGSKASPYLRRLPFTLPVRKGLPPLEKYAKLEHKGKSRVVGYVEASRGCLHLCTHCPIPPVYGGRFFIVPPDIVLEDIRRQVQAGATHITFGDPDFLNGPGHSLKVLRAAHAEFPHLTFDFTAKVEHILERRDMYPELGSLNCLFQICAVESLSETVLTILEKHHTRQNVIDGLKIVRSAGIALRPTWVAFTPWTTLEDYIEVLDFVEEYDLIDHVDVVQYTIRLLVPPGSYLLDRPAMQAHLSHLDQASFSYRWAHPDPHMDRLQKEVSALVEADTKENVDPSVTFFKVKALATGKQQPGAVHGLPADRIKAPRLSEPWFC